MKDLRPMIRALWALGLLFASGACGADIKHDFILIDEGLAQLLRVNENDPRQNWIVPIGHPQGRDMQLVGVTGCSSATTPATGKRHSGQVA